MDKEKFIEKLKEDSARRMKFMLSLGAIEHEFEWKRWQQEIPFISWPSDWLVKAVPPYICGIIRYVVKTPKCDFVSVYLDCYGLLGTIGLGDDNNELPYWEVYPIDDDTGRCAMADVDELLVLIGRAGEK